MPKEITPAVIATDIVLKHVTFAFEEGELRAIHAFDLLAPDGKVLGTQRTGQPCPANLKAAVTAYLNGLPAAIKAAEGI